MPLRIFISAGGPLKLSFLFFLDTIDERGKGLAYNPNEIFNSPLEYTSVEGNNIIPTKFSHTQNKT